MLHLPGQLYLHLLSMSQWCGEAWGNKFYYFVWPTCHWNSIEAAYYLTLERRQHGWQDVLFACTHVFVPNGKFWGRNVLGKLQMFNPDECLHPGNLWRCHSDASQVDHVGGAIMCITLCTYSAMAWCQKNIAELTLWATVQLLVSNLFFLSLFFVE